MTKPPPLLLGAAVLFWGWQSGYLPVAILIAAVLESAWVVKARWELADQDFTRIWTFCSLLFLSAALYAFTANDAASDLVNMLQNPSLYNQRRAGNAGSQSVASLIRWLPMIFMPFIAAQTFSSREGVPLQTISLILQKRWKKARKLGRPLPSSPTINIGWAYFGLCVFAAGIHPSESTEFFWGLSALLGWALWAHRSRSFRVAVWAGVLGLVVGLGYFGQIGIRHAQQYIGNFNPLLFSKYYRYGFDPSRNRTALGQVGRLKASHKIMFRVEPKEGSRVPPLLREATYRNYRSPTWYAGASKVEFENINAETNGTTFVLVPGEHLSARVSIACYLPGGAGLLPLPEGTARLENLPAFVLQRNVLGSVLAMGPGLVIFDAIHGPAIPLDGPPDLEKDRDEVPLREVPALEQIISELQLREKPLLQVLRVLHAYFQTNFTYSTWQELPPRRQRTETPLTRFLLGTKSGHCEYFATASVLLLRQLGFPARYAVGYAVHEKVGDNKFIVRQRDAHAWCLVWSDGVWREFDATPASWLEFENERISPFQKLSDLWSRLGFELSRIRYGQTNLRKYVLWGLAGVLLILLIQIVFAKRRKHKKGSADRGAAFPSWPGLDSEFYRLERILSARGFPRETGEPLQQWLSRSSAEPELEPFRPELCELLHLHYRYRFDPLGLDEAERKGLSRRVEACLARVSPSSAARPARFQVISQAHAQSGGRRSAR